MAEPDDDAILSMFRQESSRNEGFTLLMRSFREPIYWHIRRLVVSHEDAQDVLQDTFIKVYHNLDKFAGDSKLYTWLYRIATNECIRLYRNRQKFLKTSGELNEKLINTLRDTSPEDGDTILVRFQEAILRLPEKQRLVFNMRYYDELSYEDISKIMDCSVATLKTNYHYASSKIKEFMMQEG